MVDIVVTAPTEAAMRATYAAIGLQNDVLDEDGNVIGQNTAWGNVAPVSGNYAITYIGQVLDRDNPTGTVTDPMGNDVPTYDPLPGVYSYIRWNTDDPEDPYWYAAAANGVTTYWRSDNTDGPLDEQGNPTPAPLPEWFPRIG